MKARAPHLFLASALLLFAAFVGAQQVHAASAPTPPAFCFKSPLPTFGCPPPPPPPPPQPPPPKHGPPDPPTPPTPPRNFVGIVSEDVFAGDAEYRDAMLASEQRLGIGLIRQAFDWASVERSPGKFDFTALDSWVEATARHHIVALPVLIHAPDFHSSAPRSGAQRGFYPPRHPSDLGTFGAAAARRYGPKGYFWRRHRDVPRMPIRAWQVWNEPNLPVYWRNRPNARAYVRLLAATGRAIKRVDPHAEILSAGIPDYGTVGGSLTSFVTAIYRAGGRSAFDTLAVHPYARSPRALQAKLKTVRRIMDHFGDRRATMWVTEFGWADQAPSGGNQRYVVGADGQAQNVASAIALLGRDRRRLKVRGFVLYNWHDEPTYPGGFDYWGLHTGLLTLNGDPKPARDAFAAAVHRLR